MAGDIVAYLKERGKRQKEEKLILGERWELVWKIMLRDIPENP